MAACPRKMKDQGTHGGNSTRDPCGDQGNSTEETHQERR